MSLTTVQRLSGNDHRVGCFPPARIIADSDERDDALCAQFRSQFDLVPANTLERVRIAQQIRYQVYCVEHRHEPSNNPHGLEMDEFDSHAMQSLLVYRQVNAALGTVRLILPLANDLDRSFPIQRVLGKEARAAFNRIPLHSTGEVSRFSVSREFRRNATTAQSSDEGPLRTSSALMMRLGLMQALVRMSALNGITHWCAAVEPTFQRMFAAMAIRFQPLGPLVEYHGLRQPCFGIIADVLNAVKRERPSFWSILTDGGVLSDWFSTSASDTEFESARAC